MSEADRDRKEGFLRRWARVKDEAAFSQDPVRAPDNIDPDAKGDGQEDEIAAVTADQSDEAAPSVELPRLEDITPDGSIARFLQKQVPEALRRAALRQAWRSDPVISTFIEVAENQYDFNDPAGVPGFGPLPADTDMAALLRHALGDTGNEAAETDAKASIALASDDATASDRLIPETHEPGDAIPQNAVGAAERLPEPGEASALTDQRTENATQSTDKDEYFLAMTPSRRHGGALPT